MIRKLRCILALVLSALLLCSSYAAAYAENTYLTLQRKSITFKGETYYQKRRVTTVLLLGIDRWNDETGEGGLYRNGGQSDFLLLLAVDDNAKTVSSILFNRDTMCDITVLNVFGQELPPQTAQLCLAYSYGDGGAESAALTKAAVSALLQGQEIEHYYAMRLDGIGILNDLLGGIEVTLEDDFTMYDPAMTKGKTMRLDGKQAEIFTRYRYDVGDSSNTSRMQRQRVYGQEALRVLKEKMQESSKFIANLFDALEACSVTDMNRGFLINLANKMDSYEIKDPALIEGSTTIGKRGTVEFYADADSLTQALVDTLYEKG